MGSSRSKARARRWIITGGTLFSSIFVLMSLDFGHWHVKLDVAFIVAYSFIMAALFYHVAAPSENGKDYGWWLFPVGMFAAIMSMFGLVMTVSAGWRVGLVDGAIVGGVFTALICLLGGIMVGLTALSKRYGHRFGPSLRRLGATPRSRVKAYYAAADRAKPEDITGEGQN